MPTERKAIVVLTSWTGEHLEMGLDDLNEALAEGWTVASATPMGGAGGGGAFPMGWASLVLLERERAKTAGPARPASAGSHLLPQTDGPLPEAT